MKASPSLQINPLTELPVELGVMVACPGKERLVKVGTRGRDAKDAGNFDAYKLQCRQLVDGSEGKRGRGLLEQIAAALQRVATGARVAERRGFGGSRAYGLVAAALMKVVADLARHAAESGADGISTVPLPGASHAQQMQYYRALSDAAKIPVILYYMPQLGVSFSLENVLETLTVPGVTGCGV